MTAPNARSHLHFIDALVYGACAAVFTVRFVNVLMAGAAGWLLLGYFALATVTAVFSAAHWALSVED